LTIRKNGEVLLTRALNVNAGATHEITYAPVAAADASKLAPRVTTLSGKAAGHKPVMQDQESSAMKTEEPVHGPTREQMPTSAADLLQDARRQMREGRYEDAVSSYSSILTAHPQSEAAHTVLVSLGQLQLLQLGQPARALGSFDAYLAAGGGPLAEEARAARIRALRALSRSADEANAIEEFLTKHPRSFETEALRSRLTALRTSE
jgi:tetratricopeptide (TPR) repeat protein